AALTFDQRRAPRIPGSGGIREDRSDAEPSSVRSTSFIVASHRVEERCRLCMRLISGTASSMRSRTRLPVTVQFSRSEYSRNAEDASRRYSSQEMKVDAADPIEVDQRERAVANASDDFIRIRTN